MYKRQPEEIVISLGRHKKGGEEPGILETLKSISSALRNYGESHLSARHCFNFKAARSSADGLWWCTTASGLLLEAEESGGTEGGGRGECRICYKVSHKLMEAVASWWVQRNKRRLSGNVARCKFVGQVGQLVLFWFDHNRESPKPQKAATFLSVTMVMQQFSKQDQRKV